MRLEFFVSCFSFSIGPREETRRNEGLLCSLCGFEGNPTNFWDFGPLKVGQQQTDD